MGRTVVATVLTVLFTGACTARPHPALPASERGRSDLIAAAEQVLVNRCLRARGAAGPPPRQKVLFGTGHAELSVTLTTGHTVRAHTDGCLTQAHRHLYGDQPRWFHAQVTINNLRPEAQALLREDAGYRAALARRAACDDHDTACVRASGLEALQTRLEPARLDQVRSAHRNDITACTPSPIRKAMPPHDHPEPAHLRRRGLPSPHRQPRRRCTGRRGRLPPAAISAPGNTTTSRVSGRTGTMTTAGGRDTSPTPSPPGPTTPSSDRGSPPTCRSSKTRGRAAP